MTGQTSHDDALRVLIVAEHASMRFGGEASLPCHYFRVLRARGVDAWLIVHERTREEVKALFAEDMGRVRFVPDMLLQKLFYRASLLLPRRIAEATFGLANQLLTQWKQRGMVRQLRSGSTVVHQPIPVSPRFPSLLFRLGVPVLIGPMNGGMDYPPAFQGDESSTVRFAVQLGRTFSSLVHRLLPGKRDAAVLLVANERTRLALPLKPRGQVVQVPENGVDLRLWQAPAVPAQGTGNFLFLGRLVDWKALDIVLQSMKALPEATLDIVGDGPMRGAWELLAKGLSLEGRARFHGWLSQDASSLLLQQSTALLLPSIFECGGAVVLEAMATGRPVIATAWGGPQDYLDDSCGILVPPSGRENMAEDFAAAMRRLMHSPELCLRMGSAGRAKVEAGYDWEKKVSVVQQIYRNAASVAEKTASAHGSAEACFL